MLGGVAAFAELNFYRLRQRFATDAVVVAVEPVRIAAQPPAARKNARASA